MHRRLIGLSIILFSILTTNCSTAEPLTDADNPLSVPEIGYHKLTVISPTVLELLLVNTQPKDGHPSEWNFVQSGDRLQLPAKQSFTVITDGKPKRVKKIGFKRRVLYAPIIKRDIRIGNFLYLELTDPLSDNVSVEVRNPQKNLWDSSMQFKATTDVYRYSPVIHVNQVGYVPGFNKKAAVGYYLGSLDELTIPDENPFYIIEAKDNRRIFSGKLLHRKDEGFTLLKKPYQHVYEADFSSLTVPGEYRLFVPKLGVSYPFFIHEGVAAAYARTYALGMYHQRCGSSNELPYTRFVHDDCHIKPVDVPTMRFDKVQKHLAGFTKKYDENERHTAPQLKDVNSSLYPFVRSGKIDAKGGHHDAGDYSKYTTNVAELIHYLVFSADALDGVAELDNLGLPESGDGISDFIQLAKWEADFLMKMQDSDGGFYFLVYPRDRKYESHKLPDSGEPQVVFPKNTAATAASVAVLAQAGTSPQFKRAYPQEAARYLASAKKGWAFLEKAIAKHGADGAYQKITHYGDHSMHDDELIWATTEMFLATGDPKLHKRLIQSFDPNDRATMQWKWWRLYKAYGCAIRSYTFAEQIGTVKPGTVDTSYWEKCELEIVTRSEQLIEWADGNCYGTSFPFPSKRFFNGSYYLPMESVFDLAVAYNLPDLLNREKETVQPSAKDNRRKSERELIQDVLKREKFVKSEDVESTNKLNMGELKSRYIDVMVSNLNFVGGTNPNNVTFVTGLGWKRQREIVHQYAQNDRRVLPPTGIPLGSVQETFPYFNMYKKELRELSYPPDNKNDGGFPFYDRWGDAFNTKTEFVTVKLARALASSAFLMVNTRYKNQPYRSLNISIENVPLTASEGATIHATVTADNMDLDEARIVWEASNEEPRFGKSFDFTPNGSGHHWIEVEAQLPDGRRAFDVVEIRVK